MDGMIILRHGLLTETAVLTGCIAFGGAAVGRGRGACDDHHDDIKSQSVSTVLLLTIH